MGNNPLEGLIVPGLVIGGLVAVVVFKDQITDIISQITDGLGGNGGGDGDGDGGNGDGEPCVKKTCKSDETWNQDQCKCVKKSSDGGGGSTTEPKPGGQWYKANGAMVPLGKGRSEFDSNRWNKNVIGWQNGYEVMGYVQIAGGSTNGSSHIGLKMGGPNHSGGCGYKVSGKCCCWWDGGLRVDGKSYLEIEYPHPNNKNTKFFKNMGRKIDGAILGVRWLDAKEGNGRRLKFWIDKSGKANAHKWELMYDVLDTGKFMPTSYYSKIPKEIELEIRISDVQPSKIKWLKGPISRKMEGSSNYAYTRSYFNRISNLT